MKKFSLLFAFLFIFQSINLSAQDTIAPIIFIVDASGSMWGQINGKVKMPIAKDVLQEIIDSLPITQTKGLVAYGHRKKGDCGDVEYLVSPDSKDKSSFQNQLAALKPLGKTPLAYSAKIVIDKLRESKAKATIILLTDGVETCDGDLCQLIKDAQAEGIEFKMHIVGFDLKPEEKKALKCAAEAGNGNYLDASNAEELSDVLSTTTNQTIDVADPTCYLTASKNGKLIDAYIKIFDKTTGEELNPNYRSYSDTAKIPLVPGIYNFEVAVLGFKHGIGKIIQEVEISEKTDSIHFVDISFDAGSVIVEVLNNGKFWDSTVKITGLDDTKSLTQSRTYDRSVTFELEAGTYDVHMNPLKIKGAEVEQKKSFSINPYQLDTVRFEIKTGEAWIGASKNGTLVDATVSISSVNSSKSVAAGRTYTSESSNPKKFILLPGDYKALLNGVTKEIRGIRKEIHFSVLPEGVVKEMVEY